LNSRLPGSRDAALRAEQQQEYEERESGPHVS
jgi:hypothetical protein